MKHQHFRDVLIRKSHELQEANKAKRADIHVEISADPIDAIQRLGDRDVTIQSVNSNATVINDVALAIQRIDNGEYGACLECEEPISDRRLQVVPWAKYCLKCQEIMDTASVYEDDTVGLHQGMTE